jgi:hypothetical protein
MSTTASSTEYTFPPAAASPPEVLALKPNDAASATEGPHPQVSPTVYVTWTKPDGGTFIAPLSNSETYERKGYKRGAEQDIPDLVAHLAEQAAKEPAKAEAEAPKPTPKAPAEKS